MGMARLSCDGICSCRETVINGLYAPSHASVPQLHEFKMYRHTSNSSTPLPQICKLKASAAVLSDTPARPAVCSVCADRCHAAQHPPW